jgi:hypothetical protein
MARAPHAAALRIASPRRARPTPCLITEGSTNRSSTSMIPAARGATEQNPRIRPLGSTATRRRPSAIALCGGWISPGSASSSARSLSCTAAARRWSAANSGASTGAASRIVQSGITPAYADPSARVVSQDCCTTASRRQASTPDYRAIWIGRSVGVPLSAALHLTYHRARVSGALEPAVSGRSELYRERRCQKHGGFCNTTSATQPCRAPRVALRARRYRRGCKRRRSRGAAPRRSQFARWSHSASEGGDGLERQTAQRERAETV